MSEEVLRYVERFDAALVARDYESLERWVSPVFTMINPLAQQMTRPQWLAWLKADIRYLHVEREVVSCRVLGECAVITSNVAALMAVSGLYGGQPTEHHTFRTEIWAATEEGMRLQHVHLTRSDPAGAAAPSDEAERELKRCEQRRSDAMERCDRAALDELYADDFVLVHGDGSVDDKRGAIESAFRLRRRVIVPRELSIRVSGDMALLTGPMTLAVGAGAGAEERSVPIYLGQVACRTARGWRFVWSQVTLQERPR